jgi:tRNA-dihydrouridine synthase B
MLKVNNINIDKALLLAPMEDITGIAFRRLCKEMGADVVYTEFVNADGLIRSNKKTEKKIGNY